MDDLWYSEMHTPTTKLSIKVKQVLHQEQSTYQSIAVFESDEFGRFLSLDGRLMLTEKDEFIYHEMITHIAMAVQPTIKKVLLIGAGDGGVARELCKYAHIEHIDLVEIDACVIACCKQYLPFCACGFDDDRVHVHIQDGLKFVRSKQAEYDLIIVDSTDPFGPGEVLFTKEFYGACFHALKVDGILINQHENGFYQTNVEEMKSAHANIQKVFPVSAVYQAHIPTYPSGHWLFGFASKGASPLAIQSTAWKEMNIATRYYNCDLHWGAFALPNYIKELLDEV